MSTSYLIIFDKKNDIQWLLIEVEEVGISLIGEDSEKRMHKQVRHASLISLIGQIKQLTIPEKDAASLPI